MAALLRQLDFHGNELAIVDKELVVEALTDPMVGRGRRPHSLRLPEQAAGCPGSAGEFVGDDRAG